MLQKSSEVGSGSDRAVVGRSDALRLGGSTGGWLRFARRGITSRARSGGGGRTRRERDQWLWRIVAWKEKE